MNSLNLKSGLSTFDLKILGIILMIIDHFHQMFVPFGAPDYLDWFGRPVATLFFFVSVIGFTHTHSKKKYTLRFYTAMIFMNVLTFFLEYHIHYQPGILSNNIFQDLLCGTLMMYGIYLINLGKKEQKRRYFLLGILIFLLPTIGSLAIILLSFKGITSFWITTLIPNWLDAENSFMVFIIPMLYLFRNKRIIQCLLILIFAILYLTQGDSQWIMAFAIIPILLYNGKKGKGMKYFFYIFYPTHITVLYLIANFLYKR